MNNLLIHVANDTDSSRMDRMNYLGREKLTRL